MNNWKSYINNIKLDQVDKFEYFHSVQEKINEVDQMQVESRYVIYDSLWRTNVWSKKQNGYA